MTTKLPRDQHQCISCNLRHENVEASGVFYCPNPLCTVTGATYHRSKLKSYREFANHHEVDGLEWLLYGLNNLPEDPVIRVATLRSAQQRLEEVIKDQSKVTS